MYAALILFSVPMPLIAGWLSDRLGRKPLIVGAYLGGAVGFVVFLLAGSNIAGLWLGIALMGLFTFAESPQLQALLSDIAPPAIRDASYSLYFTLAFGVGSLWVAAYGFVIERLGAPTGVPARVPADGRRIRARRAWHPADPGRRARGGQCRLRGRPARGVTPDRGRAMVARDHACYHPQALFNEHPQSGRGAAW